MTDQPTTPAPATASAPGAPTATPAPAAPQAPTPVDAAIQSALDRAAKADATAYRHEQTAKQAAAEAAAHKAQLDALEKDPWGYMAKKGITPEMLLERAAVGKPAASEEVLQLREALAERDKRLAAVEGKLTGWEEQTEIGDLTTRAREFVQATQDPDAILGLEFADAMAGGKANFAAKVKAYREQAKASGVVLTYEQAAGMLRGELGGMVKGIRANPDLAKVLDKILGRSTSSEQPASPAGTPPAPGQTLKSDMAQGGVGGAPPDFSKMTREQERAYWKAKFPGEIP